MMEHDEILELDYDEEFSEYTPLERPSANSRPNNIPSIEDVQDDSFEEGEEISEESDSDSDCAPTRSKLRICQNTRGDIKPVQQITKKSANNIWSNHLQETSLTDQLIKCSVRHMNLDNSRSVESYDYRQAQLDNLEDALEEIEPATNPRKRHFNSRFTKKTFSNKRTPKIIPDLKVTEESSSQEIASDISTNLGEEKDYLILRVVELMGKRKAINLYNKTQEIEANGGMDILNRSRRRTSGGIYLMLVKNDKHTSQNTKKKIFDDDQEKKRENMKEIDLERKKSIHERLGPLTPLRISPVTTFTSRFSPISGADDELEEGECIDDDDKATLSNPPPSPESE